jgi:hypothetical protein
MSKQDLPGKQALTIHFNQWPTVAEPVTPREGYVWQDEATGKWDIRMKDEEGGVLYDTPEEAIAALFNW